jgi:Uma2 family endonuclease
MESEIHVKQASLLRSSLEHGWADRDDFYVASNMFVYFSELQTKKNDFRGPDVFVALDTVRRVRKSWVVWQEGRGPDVVIELLSPSTEKVDRGDKMRIYGKLMRVAEYYLYDPETEILEGYRLDPGTWTYAPMTREANGDFASVRLGLRIGLRPGRYEGVERAWVRWIDASGQVLPSGEDLARAAQEKARTAEEKARAAEDEARAAEEKARAAEDEARAAEEKARVAEEKAGSAEEKAAALAAKLAEYEERFGKLGGGRE